MGYTLFVLNCRYYPRVLVEDETDLYSKFRSTNKLAEKPKKPIEICC